MTTSSHKRFCKENVIKSPSEIASILFAANEKSKKVEIDAYRYAVSLAEYLHENHYDNKGWEPLGDLMGVLSQIDNMIAGISKKKPVNNIQIWEIDMEELLAMKLHEELRPASDALFTVLRVPGGWIYTTETEGRKGGYDTRTCFVPEPP